MSPGAFIRALPAPPQAHPGRPDTPCAASPAYPPPSQPTVNSIAGCADPPRQSNRAFASASDAKTLNSFSQLAGNLASETSSLKTASSSGESGANPLLIGHGGGTPQARIRSSAGQRRVRSYGIAWPSRQKIVHRASQGKFRAVGPDIAVAHQKIMEESSRVAKLMTELILDFVAAFVAKNFSITTSSSEILGQECESIANAPDVLKLWLPFYLVSSKLFSGISALAAPPYN